MSTLGCRVLCHLLTPASAFTTSPSTSSSAACSGQAIRWRAAESSRDSPRLAAVALGLGALGAGGWVAYGVNTIETSYGNVDLVDLTGAATIIKPLGLCWPAMLVLVGVTFLRSRRVPTPCGPGIVLAAALLPVSRIGNIWQLAIVVDVLLLASLVPIAWMQLKGTPRDQAGPVQSPAAA